MAQEMRTIHKILLGTLVVMLFIACRQHENSGHSLQSKPPHWTEQGLRVEIVLAADGSRKALDTRLKDVRLSFWIDDGIPGQVSPSEVSVLHTNYSMFFMIPVQQKEVVGKTLNYRLNYYFDGSLEAFPPGQRPVAIVLEKEDE